MDNNISNNSIHSNNRDNDSNDDHSNKTIKHSDTEVTVVVTPVTEKPKPKVPERIYINNMHCSSDYSTAAAATRQPSSMSNIDLGMHTIPPRIITKDASYTFIWIDDHYQDLSKVDHELSTKKRKKVNMTTRGFCNVFTILFIISIILFLFLYPFIMFLLPTQQK